MPRFSFEQWIFIWFSICEVLGVQYRKLRLVHNVRNTLVHVRCWALDTRDIIYVGYLIIASVCLVT